MGKITVEPQPSSGPLNPSQSHQRNEDSGYAEDPPSKKYKQGHTNGQYSNILGGLEPGDQRKVELRKEDKDFIGHDSGIYFERNLFDVATKKKIGPYVKKFVWSPNGKPLSGHVIETTVCVPNTDTKHGFPDENVRIFRQGPFLAKKRPMVVLWQTHGGLLCIPMFTNDGKGVTGIGPKERVDEFMSMEIADTTYINPKPWEGDTPEQGMPILWHVRGNNEERWAPRSYLDLTRPEWISFHSEKSIVGHLDGSDYNRLMMAYLSKTMAKAASGYAFWGVEFDPAKDAVKKPTPVGQIMPAATDIDKAMKKAWTRDYAPEERGKKRNRE